MAETAPNRPNGFTVAFSGCGFAVTRDETLSTLVSFAWMRSCSRRTPKAPRLLDRNINGLALAIE